MDDVLLMQRRIGCNVILDAFETGDLQVVTRYLNLVSRGSKYGSLAEISGIGLFLDGFISGRFVGKGATRCYEIISSVGCGKRGRGYVKILVMNYYCLQYIFSVLIFRFIHERAIF